MILTKRKTRSSATAERESAHLNIALSYGAKGISIRWTV